MQHAGTHTPEDFETAYHEAMSLTDPLEIIRGVVTVYVRDPSCFLTYEEQADGFARYASRLSAFNRRGGNEVAVDRAGTYRERWLAWLIADRLPGLVGLAIPRRDTVEETRKELEAAAEAHYITVRRAEAERVRSVGADHRADAPEAEKEAPSLADELEPYVRMTWKEFTKRTGIPKSTFAEREAEVYASFSGMPIRRSEGRSVYFLKAWLNKNTKIFA